MVTCLISVWRPILGLTICAAVSIAFHSPVQAQGSNTYCVSGLSSQGQYNFLVIRFAPNLRSPWRQDVQLRNGDCVQVLVEQGEFYRVRYQNRYEGWSAKIYLRANQTTNVRSTPLSTASFIFTGEKVVNPRNERQFVQIDEKLPISDLKRRFDGFEVRVTVGEDCVICATVLGRSSSFSVDYDESGITVTSIKSVDRNSVDALGNGIGTRLTEAIQGSEALCTNGEETSCASPVLPSLRYIIEEIESCQLKALQEDKNIPTKIPLCSKISGFWISKNNY